MGNLIAKVKSASPLLNTVRKEEVLENTPDCTWQESALHFHLLAVFSIFLFSPFTWFPTEEVPNIYYITYPWKAAKSQIFSTGETVYSAGAVPDSL